jgi:hypothetical protein
MTRAVLLTLALASLTTTAVTAQARRGDRPPRAGVEDLLRLRTQLELTQEQVTRLQALREEALAERIATATEMMRLRSRLNAARSPANSSGSTSGLDGTPPGPACRRERGSGRPSFSRTPSARSSRSSDAR